MMILGVGIGIGIVGMFATVFADKKNGASPQHCSTIYHNGVYGFVSSVPIKRRTFGF